MRSINLISPIPTMPESHAWQPPAKGLVGWHRCNPKPHIMEEHVTERFIVNVEVIVERDGKYLLIVRSEEEEYGAGWLSFPGGKLETTTPDIRALERTAQRELKEEVGLDVSLDDLRYVESHIFFIGEEAVLDIVMMTSAAIGEPIAMDPREVAGIVWKTPDQILADPDIPEWTQNSVAISIT